MNPDRIAEYRQRLLAVLALLDQMQPCAEEIEREPVYAEIHAQAEELREMIVDLQATVEAKLDLLR